MIPVHIAVSVDVMDKNRFAAANRLDQLHLLLDVNYRTFRAIISAEQMEMKYFVSIPFVRNLKL
jgi:hypothetical protein